MALKEADITNFRHLLRAAKEDNLCLVESTDTETGEYRAILCARWKDGALICLTPYGHMCTGNPYEQYTNPTDALKRGIEDGSTA